MLISAALLAASLLPGSGRGGSSLSRIWGSGAISPSGTAPDRRSAASRGLTINAETLGRYGYTLEGYNSLTQGERERVEDWIRILEEDREALARAGVRPGRAGGAAGGKWSAKELDEIAQLRAKSLSQGLAPAGGDAVDASAPWLTPSVSFRGSQLNRFTLRNDPHDFQLQLGFWATTGQSLLGASPYLNAMKGGKGSESFLDYSWKAQAGYVDLNARMFPPGGGALDGGIDRALGAGSVPGYSSDFQRTGLFVGSAIGQAGRAWTLFGPVDFGVSAMGLMRVTGVFPNVTLDQTAALRWRVDPDHNVAVMGGVTEAAGLLSKSVMADTIKGGKVGLDPRLETAPHVSLAAWGKLPYMADARYSVEAGHQWNPWTTVQSAAGTLSVPAGRGRVGLRGAWEREAGADIEFERNKASGGIVLGLSDTVELSGTYSKDMARYGNAQVANDSVMINLKLTEPGSKASAEFESLFSETTLSFTRSESEAMVRDLDRQLALLIAFKKVALAELGPGGLAGSWSQVQDAYNSLPPETRRALDESYRLRNPSGPPLSQIIATSPPKLEAWNSALDILADTDVLERILVRSFRSQVLAQMDKTQIPILGQNIPLTAPVLIAAAHAMSLGLTSVPPMTARDAKGALEPYLTESAVKELGCQGKDAAAMSDCLLSKLPKAEQDYLRRTYGKDLEGLIKAGVAWASDIVRREINAMLLQVFLAAERLNALTVDQGQRIGAMNNRALVDSFLYKDARQKKESKPFLERAVRQLRSELKDRDESIRAKLTEYGRLRLAAVQSAGDASVHVAIRAKDWPRLLAIYGDERLFSIIAEARERLAKDATPQAPARLIIELNEDPVLNGTRWTRGNPSVLALPLRPHSGGLPKP